MTILFHELIKDNRILLLFTRLELKHGMPTRANIRGDLVIRETRTNFGERAIQVFGSRAWNLLPEYVRNSKSLNIFVKVYLQLREVFK